MSEPIEAAKKLEVPRLERHRYAPVGSCIYCGSPDDLRDEHIVPFGLGGNLVLPDSTCGECADITSRFERSVLRGPMRPIRVMRGIQSRRRHRGAPTHLPLQVRFAEDWETVQIPVTEYPLLLQFFVYDVPGCLQPETYGYGLRVRGQMTFSFGPRPEEVLARLGARQVRVSQTYVPGDFAKMTAKVAYSMAVAVNAIDPTNGKPEVVRSILGEVDDVGRWVGMVSQPRRRIRDVLHHVAVQRDSEHHLLVGHVQYLTDTGTPTYVVVLGSVDEPYVTLPA